MISGTRKKTKTDFLASEFPLSSAGTYGVVGIAADGSMVQEYACSVVTLLRNTTRLQARIRKVLGNAYVRNE
jgi:hypothetical protein